MHKYATTAVKITSASSGGFFSQMQGVLSNMLFLASLVKFLPSITNSSSVNATPNSMKTLFLSSHSNPRRSADNLCHQRVSLCTQLPSILKVRQWRIFLCVDASLITNHDCKYPSFSSTHFLRFPCYRPSAGILPASGYSGIHGAAHCCIHSANVPLFPVLHSAF